MQMEPYYPPEGTRLQSKENQRFCQTLSTLREAMLSGAILEGIAEACDAEHNLIVSIGCMRALIPRNECAIGIENGQTREIAILSRVGKPVSFLVTSAEPGRILLSRRLAQERALNYYLQTLTPGDILSAKVTHLEPFGVFVDIGCGVVSFIGIENISVSRIFHPRERFAVGQLLHAAVLCTDPVSRRISLTHRELLGTWEENAAQFHAGETVRGIVRGIESYGVFIELTPNLSGLSEKKQDLKEGETVSVFIKSILPERMKIKLSIIDQLPDQPLAPLRYFVSSGHLDRWIYSPAGCQNKYIATVFA